MSPVYNGLILVDKPSGLSSNAVLQKIRRLLNKVKAGHTGSLDPLASGMLPIALGEATKFCQYLLDADKCYQVTARLGMTTTTGDSMGEMLTVAPEPIQADARAILQLLPQFTGTIQQIPPMVSALKHQGQPLYKLARKGIVIDRPAREIVIHELMLEGVDDNTFSLFVRCSKGTYIRTLVEDIGQCLGVGAHVTKLHRKYTAGFESAPMFTLDALMDMSPKDIENVILPMDIMVQYLPRLDVDQDTATALWQGKVTTSKKIVSEPTIVRLYEETSQHFLGIGEWIPPQELKAKRLVQPHDRSEDQ